MLPFRVLSPDQATVPILFDSPHSGREYPPDFGASASLADLRRGEDAWVDELISEPVSLGITVLSATYPRCYLDVNREVDDIDPGLLAEPWPTPLRPSEKSKRGLGLIRRLVVPGVPIYARKLTVEEVRNRIEGVHLPYHAMLRELRNRLLERHGRLWHIDWHSMKSVGNAMTPDGPGAERADFVVGDLHGRSAGPEVTGLVVERLESMGYRVAVNDPYAGGKIVREMGDPPGRVHSLQIEMNRRLYLDELRVEKTRGYETLRRDLALFSEALVSAVG